MFLCPVSKHSHDLRVAGLAVCGVGVDDVPAVGRPRREVTAAAVMGELDPALGSDLHDIDVLSAGCAGAVLAVPGEGKELAVWRPGDRCGVATVGHTLHGRAVGVHDVELRQAGASADPGDL